jgi:hypothetical protein
MIWFESGAAQPGGFQGIPPDHERKFRDNNLIKLNYYLFGCQLNSPRANYKVITNESKKERKI